MSLPWLMPSEGAPTAGQRAGADWNDCKFAVDCTESALQFPRFARLTEQIEQKHGIDTEFTDDGQAKPLEKDIQALLFRSVRELLVNVVKHSKAKRVEVSIYREEDQILIRLEDDGIGFAPDKVVICKDTGGFGLFSIRERLSQMGGSLEIDSRPGQGCRSVLRAPLQQS
jgi:signal transduction histidine kinase